MESRNEDGTIRIKKLCYALRAALCLRYAMAVKKMPPTPFVDVLAETKLEPDELDAIREVLAQKEHALESDTVRRCEDCPLIGYMSKFVISGWCFVKR